MVRFFFFLLLGAIGIAYIAITGDRSRSDAVGMWHKVLADGSPGCLDLQRLNRLQDYLDQGDPAAYQRGLDDETRSGQCIVYAYGQEAYVVDSAKSKVKMRLRGDIAEYWASRRALEHPAK